MIIIESFIIETINKRVIERVEQFNNKIIDRLAVEKFQ